MIEEISWGGTKIFVLETKRFTAWFVPAFGANLIRLFDKKYRREILRKPADIEALISAPEFFGVPVLFPPNRIKGGEFTWQNEKFSFKKNTVEGNHIHGVALSSPWRFSSLNDGEDETTISASFEFADHLSVYQRYKRLLKLTTTICLKGDTATHSFLVENLDSKPAPIGYGLHTWFHLEGGKDIWRITLPFEKVWELDEEELPTGVLRNGEKIVQLKDGISLKDKSFDTLFYRGDAAPHCILEDETGYTLIYEVDPSFTQWVVHTPQDHTDTIAIEPYSWVTNAPNLDLPDDLTGFASLEPETSKLFETKFIVPK